ncbi:hypothetical protein ABZS93_13995 [Streptomyces sp900116325]|uniref:hypothetical protein n=1 Tax=Streptomyces sp. 900116325 TaxID=3154295 RepID=UPI0033A3EFD2
MAWEEWEQLKAEAARRQSTAMQLDHVAPADGGGGGGAADLVVHQDDLGAVGHEALILHGRLQRQADIAGAGAGADGNGSGSTSRAAGELKKSNFAMASALEETVEVWTSQVNSVLQAVAHISNHLDYSKKAHALDDAWISADLLRDDGSAMPVSRLNDYFK